MDFPSWFERTVDEVPDKPLLRCQDGTRYTYQAVDDRANQVARVLNDRSDVDRVTVATILPNCPEYVFLLLGLPKVGGVAACINTDMKGEALAHLLRNAGADVAVVHGTNLDDYIGVLQGLETSPPHLFTVGVEKSDEEQSYCGDVEYHGDLMDVTEGRSHDRPTVSSDHHSGSLQTLLHTSGTTGLPKWCRICQNYHIRIGETVAEEFHIQEDDVVFNPLPLYHTNPQCYYLYGTIAARATAAMVDGFSATAFWDQVRHFGVNVLILHIAPVDIIKKRTNDDEDTTNDVRVVFPADEEFMERFDVPVGMSGYGSTEAGGLTHLQRTTLPIGDEVPDNERLSQLAGYSRDDIEVRIVDEYDREVDRTKSGEILVRPDEPFVIFDGYYGHPEKTVDVWQNLWFHTGDLGYIDEVGRLHFMSRKKESIRVNDQFVNADLVERCFRRHPAVVECAAVGVDSEIRGERVLVFVQKDEDCTVDTDELLEYAKSELPTFMVPSEIESVDTFPRTPGTEKIQKSKLTESR